MKNPFYKLLSINRFSNKTLTAPDTDAEHTIRMQLMALYIFNREPEFDIKETCFKILCHDLEECWMCDIPRPVKYHDERILGELKRVQDELISQDNIHEYIKDYMNNSKDDTMEGMIVRFLDVYDAYQTLKKEAWSQHNEELLYDSEWSKSLLLETLECIRTKDYFNAKVLKVLEELLESDVPIKL